MPSLTRPTTAHHRMPHRLTYVARRTFSRERNLGSFRGDTRRSNERSRLGDVQRRGRPKAAGRAGPALRVGRVYSNPGPDGEDRLRRVITLMVKYATSERPTAAEKDSPSETSPPEGHVEKED